MTKFCTGSTSSSESSSESSRQCLFCLIGGDVVSSSVTGLMDNVCESFSHRSVIVFSLEVRTPIILARFLMFTSSFPVVSVRKSFLICMFLNFGFILLIDWKSEMRWQAFLGLRIPLIVALLSCMVVCLNILAPPLSLLTWYFRIVYFFLLMFRFLFAALKNIGHHFLCLCFLTFIKVLSMFAAVDTIIRAVKKEVSVVKLLLIERGGGGSAGG